MYNDSLTYGQPYDFGSVMHYDKYAFAIKPEIWTIRPRLPKYRKMQIGQRIGLSETDIRKINFMYNCSDPDDIEEAVSSPPTTTGTYAPLL